MGITDNFLDPLASSVIANKDNYADNYQFNTQKILAVLTEEETKFRKTLNRGLLEIQKLIKNKKAVSGRDAFNLYQSFGFPIELIEEELKKHHLSVDRQEFDTAKKNHQDQSRTLSAGKFKSGLADHSEISAKYHTTTHLLHAALRQVLGNHIQQSGSNINPDRLRFDFTHPQPLTETEIKQVEDLVNQKIQAKLPVVKQDLPLADALKTGALAFFGAKYPSVVSVYTVDDFSRELCAGPHVKNTGEIGFFKIIKQESSGSGHRRLYAQCS